MAFYLAILVFIFPLLARLGSKKRGSASEMKPKLPKTDFSEMCPECFGNELKRMSHKQICNLGYVERVRRSGCQHRRKKKGE